MRIALRLGEIDENHIGRAGAHGGDGGEAVGVHSDDLEVLLRDEQSAKRIAIDRVLADDENADACR